MALILVLRFFILCAQLGYELIPGGRPRILTLICTRQACRRVVRSRGIQNMSNIRFVLICYNYLYSYTVIHMIPSIVKSSSFFIGPNMIVFFASMKWYTISEDDWNFSDPRTPHSGPVPLSGSRWTWLPQRGLSLSHDIQQYPAVANIRYLYV